MGWNKVDTSDDITTESLLRDERARIAEDKAKRARRKANGTKGGGRMNRPKGNWRCE